MEKQQNLNNCDSMTSVTVKDYSPAPEYQDPPPAYKNASLKSSPMVQVTKIVAVAVVAIAGMLSFALVFSAWLSSSNSNNTACQYQQSPLEALLPPEALKSMLVLGQGLPHMSAEALVAPQGNDLESAESKVEDKSNNNKDKDSSEEDNSNSGEDSSDSLFKFPVELNLHEHMFERNHRSHMNCIIEKKKAEEIVDEQSKPLPPLLGINMSTDPRYLHFTGEKMAISCDSGNDHRQAPPMSGMEGRPPPPNMANLAMRMEPPQQNMIPMSSSGSNSIPIHIIGPIPLTKAESQQFQAQAQQQHMPQFFNQQSHGSPFGMPPVHMIPVLVPNGQSGSVEESDRIYLEPQGPQMPPHLIHPQQLNVGAQSNEIRERALPYPIPIMPRQHAQHIIRPRSTDSVLEAAANKRVKRCACDCACKNQHQE
jgi:hypothetical protein